MLSCTISALLLRVYTPVARDSICPREESNRGPGRRIGRRTVSRRIARRPRGRVVRDGLGVSFRVGAAHPPPTSFPILPASFYRYTSPHLQSPTSIFFVLYILLFSFLLLSLHRYRTLSLSLSLSIQLAGARGSDPESSTALPRMAPLTVPPPPSYLFPCPFPLCCALKPNFAQAAAVAATATDTLFLCCTDFHFFLSFFLSVVSSCVLAALPLISPFPSRSLKPSIPLFSLTSYHLVLKVQSTTIGLYQPRPCSRRLRTFFLGSD